MSWFDGGIPMIFSIPDVGRLVVTHDPAAVVVLFGFDHGRNPRPVASKLGREWRPVWGRHRPRGGAKATLSGVPPGRDKAVRTSSPKSLVGQGRQSIVGSGEGESRGVGSDPVG
ncbi:hypothetical protein NL676_002268 [Syzygium grande]|nr:hypothetical protein NL676_002268 [Syzygium grande]